MIYIDRFYGGMCNNLLQFNNVLDFMDMYNIDISNLKIRNVRNKIYQNTKIDYLFDELKQCFINYKIKDFKNSILYNKNINSFDPNKDYIFYNSFYCRSHIYIYNFLNIKRKQNEVKSKLSKYLDSKNIAFHIRRGDFLTDSKFTKNVLQDRYILDIIEKNKNIQIVIFSDGTDYIKKLCCDYNNIIYASDLKLNLDIEFLFGTICNKVIQTKNSTFSLLMNEFCSFFKFKNN